MIYQSDKGLKPSMLKPTSNIKKPNQLKGFGVLVIVLIIIIGGIYFISSYTGLGANLFFGSSKTEWQAVFLTNGQVYFGEIYKMNNDFVYMKDIYYLQVVTMENTIGQAADVQNVPEQRLKLIKLGKEIHGPTDDIRINRDHVIMIENLKDKDESSVVSAIDEFLVEESK